MLQWVFSYSLPLKQMHWSFYLLYFSHFSKRLCCAASPQLLFLKNKPLRSHLPYILVKPVSSFGPCLSSLLLPSSGEKPSNSSTHSCRQDFCSTWERFLVSPSSSWRSHKTLRVTMWTKGNFFTKILTEIVTVSLKHSAKSFTPNERDVTSCLKNWSRMNESLS